MPANASRGRSHAAADPLAEAAQNVRLVGHNDLQGRTALVVTTKSDAANGNWVYVGHHESFAEGKPLLNPITGKMEWNGTSILEITDPAKPRLVWHIPNETNRNSRGVSVVYDYKFDSSGRDYLIRNSEALTQGETGTDLKYQIFDITSRDSDPSKIALVSEITGTPPDSCGRGLRRQIHHARAQRLVVRGDRLLLRRVGEPGFRNVIVQIFDLKNPKEPKFVGRAWLPGLKDGEPGYEGQYSHHPVVDEENKRLYVGYRNAGGQAASFDISNPAQPKLVWSIDMNPPHRGPHTVSPIVYDDGAELREERLAADLRLHRGRGRRRARHEAVPERRAPGILHARHHDGDEAVPCLGVAGARRQLLREGRALRAAPVSGHRERQDQPVRGQDRVARILQCRRQGCRFQRSVQPGRAGVLHPEDRTRIPIPSRKDNRS